MSARSRVAVDLQLELPAASTRFVALLREQKQLMAKVASKKGKVADLEDRVDARNAALAQLAAKLAPLFEEAVAVDAEIHALFAALRSKKGLKRSERRLCADVYEMLQDEGIIQPAGDDVPEASDVFGSFPADDADGDDTPPRTAREPASAKRPAGAKVTAVRELFRRLASAIHPDKAPDARSQAERTEVMKEVTSAYQEGDLARLLELEKAWLVGHAARPVHDGDDGERRCANLERINRELRAQLRDLDRRLRELRNALSYDPIAAMGVPRAAAGAGDDVEVFCRERLESARQLRDFVRSFLEGRISFDAFMAGPAIQSSDAELGDAFADDDFMAFVADLGLDVVIDDRPRRPSRQRRKKGR